MDYSVGYEDRPTFTINVFFPEHESGEEYARSQAAKVLGLHDDFSIRRIQVTKGACPPKCACCEESDTGDLMCKDCALWYWED